jgi:hypothetical protein
MGANPSLPDFKVSFDCKCCNGKDETDMVRSVKSRGFRERLKIISFKRKVKTGDTEMVARSASVQPKPSDEETIPDEEISNIRP